MREIKFRAWDTTKKQMFDVICLDFKEHGYIDEEIEWHKDFICHLMQYTGLKDKNGKEIYESDIYRDELGCINEVEFEDGTWSYAYDILEMCEEPSEEWEVLGNIYENPELLESE